MNGVPVPVVDGVAMNLTDGAAAFDVSENGHARLPAGRFVRHGHGRGAGRTARASNRSPFPRRDRYNNPRLSPDGGRLSVDIRSANSMGDVWVFQIGRSGGTRLTAEGGRDFGAEWTPDGRS